MAFYKSVCRGLFSHNLAVTITDIREINMGENRRLEVKRQGESRGPENYKWDKQVTKTIEWSLSGPKKLTVWKIAFWFYFTCQHLKYIFLIRLAYFYISNFLKILLLVMEYFYQTVVVLLLEIWVVPPLLETPITQQSNIISCTCYKLPLKPASWRVIKRLCSWDLVKYLV